MVRRIPWKSALIAGLALGQAALAGSEACRTVFAQLGRDSAAKVAESFPDVTSLPLPENLAALIARHPISRFSEDLKGGEGLIFNVTPKEGALEDGMLGEQIQASYVRKVIEILFPKAAVIGRNGVTREEAKKLGGKQLNLPVTDSAEDPAVRGWGISFLDMPILKAANPTLSSLRSVDVRAIMGIPRESRVASVYTRTLEGIRGPGEADPLLPMVIRKTNADVVFLSRAVGAMDSVDDLPPSVRSEIARHGFEVILLSALTRGDFKPGRKLLVINDTRGILPFLHRASDLAVVRGPMNIFEPLQVGTRTVFYRDPAELAAYDPAAFREMEKKALKTGGAFAVSKSAELEAAMDAAIRSRSPIEPPYSAGGEQDSSFGAFLRHLQQEIEKQLR